MPLDINALQVPAHLTTGLMAGLLEEELTPSWPFVMKFPLQYEHTLLQTEMNGPTWIQFNVVGLPFGETTESVKMDKEGQKMIQIRLGKKDDSSELLIEDLQVVERKDRAQPFRMRCGKLAMDQTSYDPNEWDKHGKFGTWSRTWNVFMGKAGGSWGEKLLNNVLLLPLALSLAFILVVARRWYQQREQEKDFGEEELEIALLGSYYEDAPPTYANIPVIKIEECD
ncbi:uncharacterized protein K460DRAFT_81541 [Cucurbitaria berberidis CBS 394.84]|uniref:Uncharacterized protein n=1 Tax=Cucurbitaria berberidis CBS 394.84 TaxID=1168544 RepID=A0A9P4LBZ2_9PLEO|nr:uncharacterized protein K460DRAFT_81541 [Cucurbitaria berberidis CBS 394.84]KAF1848842.1 hypothetical protein K460DRAFT_81541 [Cucurbitaria berberidis CBS 394.84]